MLDLHEKINLNDGSSILRIICGLFFIPHIVGKLFESTALTFFVAAKFRPPAFWMYLACAIEIVFAIGLIFGIYTTYVAALSAAYLGVASVAVYRVTGGKWLWNIGGIEYCVFWTLCCIVVAIDG